MAAVLAGNMVSAGFFLWACSMYRYGYRYSGGADVAALSEKGSSMEADRRYNCAEAEDIAGQGANYKS